MSPKWNLIKTMFFSKENRSQSISCFEVAQMLFHVSWLRIGINLVPIFSSFIISSIFISVCRSTALPKTAFLGILYTAKERYFHKYSTFPIGIFFFLLWRSFYWVIDNVCNFGIFMPYKIIIFSKQFCSLFHEAIVKEYFPMCSRIEERCSLGLFFESVRQSCVRGRRLSKGCRLMPRKKLRGQF